MNMTIVENTQMPSKIKNPKELREEHASKHEKEVNYLLVLIRSQFTGVPCAIKLAVPTEVGIVALDRPDPEV